MSAPALAFLWALLLGIPGLIVGLGLPDPRTYTPPGL